MSEEESVLRTDVHFYGSSNQDGSANIEFIVENAPMDAALLIRARLQDLLVELSKLADGVEVDEATVGGKQDEEATSFINQLVGGKKMGNA